MSARALNRAVRKTMGSNSGTLTPTSTYTPTLTPTSTYTPTSTPTPTSTYTPKTIVTPKTIFTTLNKNNPNAWKYTGAEGEGKKSIRIPFTSLTVVAFWRR